MKVLVTGGAGYIGAVTATALEAAGHEPVLLDSLVTGPAAFARGRVLYEGHVGDRSLLRRIVADHPDLACTLHMAARTVVPESVAEPLLYYRENVSATLDLVDELASLGKPDVVFSSSASVYAPVAGFEVDEDSPVAPASPYARTKLVVEQALADAAAAGRTRALLLRYFNPIGSDPEERYGVYARDPSHVSGQLTLAALGRVPAFSLTGTDLPTRDGSGLRDYVHVWDVARAHVAAVERFDAVLRAAGAPSVVVNVGTGTGVTVRELVAMFEEASGRRLAVEERPGRPGDAVGAFANVDRARRLLGWQAELTVRDGVRSTLSWMARRHRVLGYP